MLADIHGPKIFEKKPPVDLKNQVALFKKDKYVMYEYKQRIKVKG